MKNFPEQDQSNELEKRLQGYTEEPDELVWQNIDKALRPGRRIFWFPWLDRLSALVVIALAGALVNFDSRNELHATAVKDKHQNIAGAGPLDASTNTQENQVKLAPELTQGNKKASASKSALEKNQVIEESGVGFSLLDKKQHQRISLQRSSKGLTISSDEESKTVEAETSAGPALAGVSITDSVNTLQTVSEIDNSGDSVIVVQQVKQDAGSQTEDSPKESKRKISKRGFSFYASLTPQLSFQRVVPAGNDGIVITEVNDNSIFSSDRFGFSINAGLQGHIAKRLEYYGGFSLHQQKQTLRYSYQTEGQTTLEQEDDRSYLITPKTTTAIVQYRMLNLGADLGLLYNLQGKKLTHKMGAGLSYQQGFNKGSSERYNNSESSYLFYQIFYRNEVRVGNRLRVYVQPTFSHSLYTNEKLEAPFTLKPYRAGIGFGILYDF
jgi:hypothetical protein